MGSMSVFKMTPHYSTSLFRMMRSRTNIDVRAMIPLNPEVALLKSVSDTVIPNCKSEAYSEVTFTYRVKLSGMGVGGSVDNNIVVQHSRLRQ